jgi:hypothetical protein
MTNSTAKSFLLYKDSLLILDKLTDAQAGKLFKAIKTFQLTENIVQLDFALEIAFSPFLNQFSRDRESYSNSVLQGKLGNLKKYHKEIYQRIIAKELTIEEGENLAYPDKKLLCRPPITPDQVGSHSVSDNVSVSVSVSDSKNKKDIKKILKKEITISIPDFIDSKIWNQFLNHRIKKNSALTDDSAEIILKNLGRWEVSKAGNANQALEDCIAGGWRGIFEPKTNQQNQQFKSAGVFFNVD